MEGGLDLGSGQIGENRGRDGTGSLIDGDGQLTSRVTKFLHLGDWICKTIDLILLFH
jgi:hypothetical protein